MSHWTVKGLLTTRLLCLIVWLTGGQDLPFAEWWQRCWCKMGLCCAVTWLLYWRVFHVDKVDCRRSEATSNVGFDHALPAMHPLPGTAWEDARVLWAKCDVAVKWQGSWGVGGWVAVPEGLGSGQWCRSSCSGVATISAGVKRVVGEVWEQGAVKLPLCHCCSRCCGLIWGLVQNLVLVGADVPLPGEAGGAAAVLLDLEKSPFCWFSFQNLILKRKSSPAFPM